LKRPFEAGHSDRITEAHFKVLAVRTQALVFLDETGTTIKMTRLRGRCVKAGAFSRRLSSKHWQTQTFIAGLRCDPLSARWIRVYSEVGSGMSKINWGLQNRIVGMVAFLF
jgi:hypothetical protein